MPTLSPLAVPITANIQGLQRGLNKAEDRLQGFRSRVSRVSSKVRGAFQSMTDKVFSWQAAMGAAAGAAGLGYMINQSLAATQQLEKLSKQTGFSTKAIQELNFAAQQTGVQSSRLYDALGEMSQRMGEAAADFRRTGGDVTEMGEGFQAAGIAIKGLAQRNPQQIFYRVADAIKNAETQSQALNIAVKTFGDEGGRDMVAMLREGSKGLRSMATRARELGLVLDKDVIKQSAEAKEKVDLLADVIGTQFQRVVGTLAPMISNVADNMADWVKQNKELLKQDVPNFILNIAEKASFVADMFAGVKRTFQVTGRAIAVTALGIEKELWELADVIWNGPIDAMNALIKKYQNIPDIIKIVTPGLMKLPEDFQIAKTQTGKGIENHIEGLNRAIKAGREDMVEILTKPMPSDFLDDLTKKSKESEKQMKSTGKSIYNFVMNPIKDSLPAFKELTEEMKNTSTVNKNSESAFQRVTESLKDQLKQLRMNDKEWDTYQAMQKLGADATKAQKEQVRELVNEYYRLKDAMKWDEKVTRPPGFGGAGVEGEDDQEVRSKMRERRQRFEKTLNSLKDQRKQLQMTEQEWMKYRAMQKAGGAEDLTKQQREQINKLIGDIQRLRAEQNKLSTAWKDIKDMGFMEQLQTGVSAGFKQMQKDAMNFAKMSKKAVTGAADSMSQALTDFVMKGKADWRELANSVMRMITQMMTRYLMFQAIKSVGFAAAGQGAVFQGGKMTGFASGGVVDKPTVFPMANGVGIMGEKGPEAVMPLTRTQGGDLGVKSEGAGKTVQQNFNINVQAGPDGKIAQESMQQMQRKLSRTVKNAEMR